MESFNVLSREEFIKYGIESLLVIHPELDYHVKFFFLLIKIYDNLDNIKKSMKEQAAREIHGKISYHIRCKAGIKLG